MLVGLMASCSSAAPESTIVPSVAAGLDSGPGAWAVLSRTTSDRRIGPRAPLTADAAAARGAKAGAAAPLMPAAATAGAIVTQSMDEDSAAVGMILFLPLLAAGLVIAPVAAAVGAGAGAAAAHPEAEIATAEANVEAALDDWQPERLIREAIVRLAGARTDRGMVDCGPTTSAAACLAEAGADTVMLLTVEIDHPGFVVKGSIEPALGLLLVARVRALRPADGRQVFCRSWLYRGLEEAYFALAADEARRLRAAFVTANEALAAAIVQVVTQGDPGGVLPRTPQLPGTVRTLEPTC